MVFIDLGANNGDSLKNFFGFEMSSGGGGNLQKLLPKQLIQQAESNKWEIHAYEANPYFNPHLAQVKRKLQNRLHNVYLNNETAAWTHDGQIDFYLDTVNKDVNFWGSSVNKNAKDVQLSQQVKVRVACHEIARIIKQYEVDDIVVVKMDIEGAEYDLLIDLFRKDALRLIDWLAIEYHPSLWERKVPIEFFDTLLHLDGVEILRWH